MSERVADDIGMDALCKNCEFLKKPDPDRYIPAFGWCEVPLPPHLIEWGRCSDRQLVQANYSCVLWQPAKEPQG